MNEIEGWTEEKLKRYFGDGTIGASRVRDLIVTISELTATIATLRAQVAEQAGWKPVSNGYNTGRIGNFEIQIGIDSGAVYIFNIRKNRECWEVPLDMANLAICCNQRTEGQG